MQTGTDIPANRHGSGLGERGLTADSRPTDTIPTPAHGTFIIVGIYTPYRRRITPS